jgi:hypothetical protein
MARAAKHALVLLIACGTLVGCGSSHPAESQSTSSNAGRAAPPPLVRAREARSCSKFADDQMCTYFDQIERWFDDGTLQGRYVGGAVALVENGCLSCHVYREIGMQNLAAPELTHVGATKTAHEIGRVIVCPKCVSSDTAMPAFGTLPKRSVDQLAQFLASSR